MNLIIDFLAKDRMIANEKETNKVRQVATWYWLSADHKLYWRSFGGPYLQCLPPSKIDELLTELYEGVCGSHVMGHSLAHQEMIQGFWWPRMHKDAVKYIRKCEQCQKHAPLIHQSVGNLIPISSLWPFAQ